MAYLQQISGLTGRKVLNPLMLKNPYGVLGSRKTEAAPVEPVDAAAPLTETRSDLPTIDIPGLLDGGGMMGSPPQGEATRGRGIQGSITDSDDMGHFSKGSLGLIGGLVGPDVVGAIAEQSIPAAEISALGLASLGPPQLGLAKMGTDAVARSMANTDLANSIDQNDISAGQAQAAVEASKKSDQSSDLSFMGLNESLSPEAFSSITSAARSRDKAVKTPVKSIVGRMGQAIKSGDLGENWSEDSLLDNMAREAITPESTRDQNKDRMVQEQVLDPKTNTYSNVGEGTNSEPSGFGDMGVSAGIGGASGGPAGASVGGVGEGVGSIGGTSSGGMGASGVGAGIGGASGGMAGAVGAGIGEAVGSIGDPDGDMGW